MRPGSPFRRSCSSESMQEEPREDLTVCGKGLLYAADVMRICPVQSSSHGLSQQHSGCKPSLFHALNLRSSCQLPS